MSLSRTNERVDFLSCKVPQTKKSSWPVLWVMVACLLEIALEASLGIRFQLTIQTLVCHHNGINIIILCNNKGIDRWGLGHFLSSNYTVYMSMAEIVKILSKMYLHLKKIHQMRANY